MATITDLTSGDSGSTSLGVINTNFDNLNDDKIEADSSDTLTNKTIDVDNNTISNIETDNLKSSAKTGLDTKVVTGTAGDDGELSKFNSDGDLVSTDVTITTTAPTSTSTDTTVPTSQAVYEALNELEGGSKELFIYPSINSTGATANPYTGVLGDFSVATIASSAYVGFNFRVPTDYQSLLTAVVVMIPDATETIQWDVTTDFGAAGELYTANSGSITNETASATGSVLIEGDISSALVGMSAGDYVGVKFVSNTSNLRVIGMYLKYE